MVKRTKGGAYSFGSSAVAPEAPYAQVVVGGPQFTPDCLAATRYGLVGPVSGSGGLPGFSGGGRIGPTTHAITQGMAGGRYMVDVGTNVSNPNGSGGPGLGNYATITRIGCEGGLVNTSPSGASANPVVLQNGGTHSAAYMAPTAGYDNKPSEWVSSTGSPSLLQIPYEAGTMNPACLKTGGSRRYRKSTRRSRRKHRKTMRRK